MIADMFTIFMLSLGCVFFIAGTIGLLRFPDVFCRLHALTKADNLGLGLITLGLLPQAQSLTMALKMLLVWGLLLLTSATSCHLIARHERRRQLLEHDHNQRNHGKSAK